MPEQYRHLRASAVALEVAEGAAQLSYTIAQLAAGGKPPRHGKQAACSGGGGGEGGSSAGGSGLVSGGEAGFGQWYLGAFADCFATELEALHEAEAPAPTAVLRRCIVGQAQLFPASYQQLAVASICQVDSN